MEKHTITETFKFENLIRTDTILIQNNHNETSVSFYCKGFCIGDIITYNWMGNNRKINIGIDIIFNEIRVEFYNDTPTISLYADGKKVYQVM